MHLIADLTILPLGAGLSISPYVARVEQILHDAGLTVELHANGTNVEGDWDAVMAALKRCHDVLHAMGVPRIHTVVKLGTRTDKAQRMADKTASVLRHLEAGLSEA